MARPIPDETIRRIKNTANIVEVIAEHVELRKAGRNYLGLCPFHAEKTASFTVSPEKQMYYCFGCHAGGTVFNFLMQREGLSYVEAVKTLAGRYGIEIPDEEMSPARKRIYTEREKLFRINELAVQYFKERLRDPQVGAAAMEYLLTRGMTSQIIDGYDLGYAPARWDGLLNYLQSKRVPVELAAKSGLVVARSNGSGYYDRFRDRVMIPIFDLHRRVIAFGGRVMGNDLPKYLNSPETQIFSKSGSLYGIEKARASARTAGIIYVAEGYFDVLAMHMYGMPNTVATLGTALTAGHVQALKGIIGQKGRVVLVYDGDQAGIKAAKRSIGVFEEGFVDARILVLPDGHDPDEYLRKNGPDQFAHLAESAMGMISFLIRSAIQEHGLSIEGKIRVMAELQEPLGAVQDPVARSLYVKQLSEQLGIDETTVLEKIRSRVGGQSARSIPSRAAAALRSAPAAERSLEGQLIAMLIHNPDLGADIISRNVLDRFEDAGLKSLAEIIIEQGADHNRTAAESTPEIDDPALRALLARLAIQENRWDPQGFERLLGQLEARHRKRTFDDLQRKIEEAERMHDYRLLGELLRQKQNRAARG